MHYYEHHIGDFMRDTAHLTAVEEGIYRRALDWYYINESPLPLDVKKLCRQLRARTQDEIDAVHVILEEYFTLLDDGYHQSRCDREIADFKELEPEIEAKKENARERQRRTRERRKELFEFLRDHNLVPAYDTAMSELQRMVDHIKSQSGNTPVTRDSAVTSQQHDELHSCDATTTHYPLPNTHNIINSLSQNASEEKSENPKSDDPNDWKPDLGKLNTKLKMAGAIPIDQKTLDQTLVTFNPHYEAHCLSDNQKIGKLVSWIKRERQTPAPAAKNQFQQVAEDQEKRQTDTTRTQTTVVSAFEGLELIEFKKLQRLKPEITQQQIRDQAKTKGVDCFQMIRFLVQQQELAV